MSDALKGKVLSNQPIISANIPGKPISNLLMFVEFWITIILMILLNRIYYAPIFAGKVWSYLLLPVFLYGLLWQFFIITLVLTSITYKILTWIEPPKEGIFDFTSREAKYYNIRFWVCFYGLYFARAMPLPWSDMYFFRLFGSHIGKNIVLYDSWIDPEFVDIEDNCMISLNTQLISHAIVDGKLVIKKISIKKSAIVGAGAVIAPGTVINEGAVLGAACSTKFDQELEAYAIHVGFPSKTSLPIKIKRKVKKDRSE